MIANSTLLAIVLTVVASGILAGMDSLGKILMRDFATEQVTWARYFFHAIFVTVFFSLQGYRDFFIPKAPKMQLLRGICMVAITFSLYVSIKSISLAEATAVMYLSPVLITLLSGVFLGELISRRHLFAVLLGFLGVLIITKPGFREFDPAIVIAFFAAFLLALYFLLTRKVASIDNQRTSLFYSSIVGGVVLTIFVPFSWVTPSLTQWLLLISLGGLGAFGHFLLIKAYSLAPASSLSPYLNSQVVAATIYSVIVFDDVLEWNFYLGTSLIIGAGLFLWFYQRYVVMKQSV